ncbi:ABC transporter substrate-binding protein [Alteromonas sp. A081]|uniref:ABC transporter substrate-binding protein n=1 Tax=Alteromonas sp. A081 TaxID=3410269 RepID=UPI003B982387
MMLLIAGSAYGGASVEGSDNAIAGPSANSTTNANSNSNSNLPTNPNPVVRFHAWGGSAQVNSYLTWVAESVERKYSITLTHVKLADTSDAVSRVLAEKAAGNSDNGSVDLIWINGENFAAMKKNALLATGWVSDIANFALTNPDNNSAMVTDFGEPTLGMEAPWGKASMVFYYRKAHFDTFDVPVPRTLEELLQFSQQLPGRFTYPVVTDYLGISFIKYAAIALNSSHQHLFYKPVTQKALEKMTPSLWTYLDALHPTMWRNGEYMVRQASQLQRLIGSGELSLAFSFTAAEIPSAVERFDLPKDVRTFAMSDGSLANVHFIGLPFNSPNHAAAKTVVNFLLSPEAQAKKQRLQVWGDDTVLDTNVLSASQKSLFETQQSHPSALDKSQPTPLYAEPHASWTDALRQAWEERYGARY